MYRNFDELINLTIIMTVNVPIPKLCLENINVFVFETLF